MNQPQAKKPKRQPFDLTTKEAELLWHVIGNGAGDDAITQLGFTKAEQKTFAALANRLADSFNLAGPRFHEE